MPAVMSGEIQENKTNGAHSNQSDETDKSFKSEVYFVDRNQNYEPLIPAAGANLISLYGLDEISKSVARSNPDGSKGVKLRKSYKNHIADLPGKHVIPKERNLSYAAFQPRDQIPPIEITVLDESYLRQCLDFDKTNGAIPGFDVIKLGMVDDEIGGAAGGKVKRRTDDAMNNNLKKKARIV